MRFETIVMALVNGTSMTEAAQRLGSWHWLNRRIGVERFKGKIVPIHSRVWSTTVEEARVVGVIPYVESNMEDWTERHERAYIGAVLLEIESPSAEEVTQFLATAPWSSEQPNILLGEYARPALLKTNNRHLS